MITHRIFSWGMWTLSCSIWDLVPCPGIKPGAPALGAWRLSHWTPREVEVLAVSSAQNAIPTPLGKLAPPLIPSPVTPPPWRSLPWSANPKEPRSLPPCFIFTLALLSKLQVYCLLAVSPSVPFTTGAEACLANCGPLRPMGLLIYQRMTTTATLRTQHTFLDGVLEFDLAPSSFRKTLQWRSK